MTAPLELELVRHGLESMVDEMAMAMIRTAYSQNLKSSIDLATALCTPAPHPQLLAQSLTLPLHLFSIPHALGAVCRAFGDDVHPGDVFALNDPYDGGTHLPDIFVMRPVFVAGRLAAWVCTTAHHADIGGRVAGGNACDSTEIYAEGLRIPPLRLFERGRRVDALFTLLERNVRVPTVVLGDLHSQLAACHVGERAFGELVERHGLERLEAIFPQLLDGAERFARAEIAGLPDGDYPFVDYLDDDGIDPDPIPLRITVRVRGDRLIADFTGSAPQVRGAINCPIPFTRSVVYACVRCIMDERVPNNAGCYRPIEVIAPPGTVVNPEPPAPVAARGLTGFRLANTVFGALAQIAPDRVPAAESGGDTGISIGGYDARRRPFVYLEFLFGGWGGRPDRDGIDGCASMVVNFANNPIEMVEASQPLRIERYGFVPDSGGPGRYRGGLALVKEYRFLEAEGTLQIRSDRHRFRPYGLDGGGPGAPASNVLNPGTPEERVLPSKTLLRIKRGDLLRHTLAGAGGYGDPRRRDPDRLRDDLRNGKVTPEAARRDYGGEPASDQG
jgi:N-methylhydantoinase B